MLLESVDEFFMGNLCFVKAFLLVEEVGVSGDILERARPFLDSLVELSGSGKEGTVGGRRVFWVRVFRDS